MSKHIKFTKHYDRYCLGDVAEFSDKIADKFIEANIAEEFVVPEPVVEEVVTNASKSRKSKDKTTDTE